MLNLDKIKELSKKYQTDARNIIREYVQHEFLNFFYQTPESGSILFKGGTALRIIYQSPRFSEDLDFTGINIFSYRLIESPFIDAARQLEKEGMRIELKEAKQTTGGYLGIILYQIFGISEQMKFEISLRKGKTIKQETDTIISEYAPAYTITHVGGQEIVNGKIAALLDRSKPRDFYDLYFILRHPRLHQYIRKDDYKKIDSLFDKVRINFKSDLSPLLPASHQMILKDFKNFLRKEIKSHL
ncbi:MAG: nucleotidyl transferase AbiEii/AbiGii toxin family protein [bacterium]